MTGKCGKKSREQLTRNWKYVCTAWQWWGESTDHAEFRYTDGGKEKMQAWQDKYLEADWTVSVKIVRGKEKR